ncbi:Rieske (2Fe-2S) protein [Oscillatoriales cyanobacterium LEGE 11467]|uniref:Rieske (2Fe-2S) protein n=1 Tax=Zarconia navalis LEGE 11467 TaxID=1828826 RepID=A0A928VXQ6_9CYAN|nr:Rieske (2Fe-2S) protein [Zarconia navalis]MBE9042214.1 Rieske (2Fe-2S) protein [Zarconia navalis LEGE 11467]
MAWVKALPRENLEAGGRQVVKIGDRKILLVDLDGKICAVNNACPHLKLPLKKGKITPDGAIVCPFHRSAFDLCTGEVKTWSPFPPVVGNLLGKISAEKTLEVFPTRIESDSIWVDVAE